MENSSLDNIVYSVNVIEFVTVANEYCTYLENIKELSRIDITKHLQKLLPLIYIKGSLLPELDEDEEIFAEKFVSEDDYNYLVEVLKSKFKDLDPYLEVFKSDMEYSEEPLPASISEDLADIYQDLKDFIVNYRIGSEDGMTAALYECKANFALYWGQALTNCLRAIHNLIFGDAELDDQAESQGLHTPSEGELSADKILTDRFSMFGND